MRTSYIALAALLLTALLLFVFNAAAAPQNTYKGSDCKTLKYLRHKVSSLCGTVSVCSGDICGNPSQYDLDDEITVELRDKAGRTVLESKKVAVELRESAGTTQDNKQVSIKRKVRTFCFTGRVDGDYTLAFVLSKNGIPQPAVMFPTTYSHKRHTTYEPNYMVEPSCPK